MIAEVGMVDNAEILAAALLHDTLEDTDTTRKELTKEFGPKVDDLVAQVTDDQSLEKDERKKQQVERAPHLSPGAKLIKIADKISNVREIAHDPPEGWDQKRREKYFEHAKKVVDAMGSVNPELERVFQAALTEASFKLQTETLGG